MYTLISRFNGPRFNGFRKQRTIWKFESPAVWMEMWQHWTVKTRPLLTGRRAVFCSQQCNNTCSSLLDDFCRCCAWIIIIFYNHVIWRKSRKEEKGEFNCTIETWADQSIGKWCVCEAGVWGIRCKKTVSDIRKAKSKLTEYAVTYSVDGYSSKSSSVAARQHDCFFKTAQSRRLADAPGITVLSLNKPPTSTSHCSYTIDTSVPPAQPTISSTPLKLQSSSDSE